SPFNLTLSAHHDQNTNTGLVNVTLPEVVFNMTPQTPFQKKNPVGQSKWFEKITVGYTFQALNKISFVDSTLDLNNLSFQDFSNGMIHKVPVSASYNVLRFINLNFNANYNEYWLTRRDFKYFDALENNMDTVTKHGFFAARDFGASASMSTRIYGMKMFKKGSLRGIRHVLTPSVSYNYRPDFGETPFQYSYSTFLDTTNESVKLSPYEQGVYGYPALGEQGNIAFSLNNNLQVKVRDSKDSTTGYKNVTLIDGL